MVQSLGQHVTDMAQEEVGPDGAHPPGSGVDLGPPQGLVGVDVAHAGDRALRQQLGLDPSAAGGQRPVEAGAVQQRVKRLGSEVVQGGQRLVVAGLDDGDTAEAPDISEPQGPAVG